jgi:putative glutamine amidotransferase
VTHVLVSQRAVVGPHGDPRDALEWTYVTFLESLGMLAVPVSNATRAVDACFTPAVTGVVLTGGNDVDGTQYGGERGADASPARDAVEAALIEGALSRRLPVLGLCRGMQFLNVHFGGALVPSLASHPAAGRHRPGATHTVDVCEPLAASALGATELTVNSFHNQAVTTATLAPALRPFLQDAGSDIIEGLFHPDLPVAGVQFHPERQAVPQPADVALLSAFRDRQLFWEKR